MNTPMTSQRHVVIVGVTEWSVDTPSAMRLSTCRVMCDLDRRRNLGIPPSSERFCIGDFADCSPLARPVSDQDAVIFCMGAYTGVVSDVDSGR